MTKDLRPNRIITVGSTTSVAANTTSPSTGLRVDWPSDGIVLYAMGTVQGVSTNDALQSGLSSLGFNLELAGVESLVSNGLSKDYVQFSTVFPTSGFRFPLGIRVKQTEAWFVFFRNVHSATAFTPNFAFGFHEFNNKRGL